ncbi:hypothetical protein Sjap_012645 [Stephania japonica]|uniref:Glycosyltransferase n=1 Tax=Stephania japonica TaxID=461633 RepID=A0AAP0IWH0_9MAGN
MANNNNNNNKVVVMFPFMAQGHILPFFSLALYLEQKAKLKIIFINTPLNVKNLKPSLPPNSTITLASLPFNSSHHNLPADSENTDSLPYSLILNLLKASLSLKQPFHDFISQLPTPPLCIVADMFFGWTADVAKEFGSLHTLFLTCGAYGSALYSSLWLHLPQCHTSDDEFAVPEFPEVPKIHRSQLASNLKLATGDDAWSKVIHKELIPLWMKSRGVLINTVEEIDQTGLVYFRRKFGSQVPIWSVVPTMLNKVPQRPNKKSGIDVNKCIDWLNNKSSSSVLFVSFGSQNTIGSSQMMELAHGLESSGRDFIWVVRPPFGFDINQEFRYQDWLPEGFEERIAEQNRGVIVQNWAPQLEILSHKSTCAFLSHCGWNSVLESLSRGVPIIGWPMAGEQFYNSKLMEEELGVCVEIGRGPNCDVNRGDIARAIETVMGGGEKGQAMRKKAGEIKEMFKEAIRDEDGCKGSCVRAIDDFVHTLLDSKNKAT